MMDQATIALITALGAPILIALGGLLTWMLKSRREELRTIEEKARERRIEIYNTLLNPLIVLFSSNATKKEKEKAEFDIGSIQYRKAAFNLVTFGSDEMVHSYNKMMQSFYQGEASNSPELAMKKFADFLLNVRKDVYTKKTKLQEWDTLKFMITDIEKLIT